MNIVLDFGRFCCSTLYPRWPLLSPQRPVDPSLFCHALKHAWWDGLGCTRKLIMTHRHGRHRRSWQTWHNSFSNVLASCLPFCRPGWQGRLRTTVVLFFCGMGQKHGRDATLWLETIRPGPRPALMNEYRVPELNVQLLGSIVENLIDVDGLLKSIVIDFSSWSNSDL